MCLVTQQGGKSQMTLGALCGPRETLGGYELSLANLPTSLSPVIGSGWVYNPQSQ